MRVSRLLISLARSRAAALLGVVLIVGAVVVLIGRDKDPNGQSPADSRPDGERGLQSPRTEATRARVLRVVDGDTIVVSLDGTEERVRYIGIDTPETEKPDQRLECYADQATQRNLELVDGTTVGLEFDRELRDRFGRLLAYVEVGGIQINEALVRDGFARTLAIEPNTARAEELAGLEVDAGRAGRGLWGACES